jgi:hypothetical protein
MPRFKDMNRSIPGLRSHVLGDGDMKISLTRHFLASANGSAAATGEDIEKSERNTEGSAKHSSEKEDRKCRAKNLLTGRSPEFGGNGRASFSAEG